ncbi:type II toxin-antitoxin system mRNA interferase toxin, RelE/StbE family [Candidatus Daviesbacteria bacterium]|nr:type II toxin-antitoxin system mRNA interferase toxin, RelE/StbE family [Candidatus Daviesbacteria bacterium]
MTIKYTSTFLKQLKKSDVRTRKAFKERLLIFTKNPHDLELNDHPLKREYIGFSSIDITSDYRAIYKTVTQKNQIYIYFTLFGTHAQLYEDK